MKRLRHEFTARQRGAKYGNRKVTIDGITFDSKKEARYYSDLKIRVKAGEVITFLMQVPFHLTAGVKYVADFMEFRADGSVHVIDVKGVKTDVYKLKKKQVEELYPVVIEEV
ncbi:DUF1064 domain-containing protein [Vibrio parahaemolyticus]|nr:DUF1064 domain-containing protein [Vibrio parahaemolyticus]EJC7066894.1 DUF1064 domain-containing protein [Vibrio parahaemolyticus]